MSRKLRNVSQLLAAVILRYREMEDAALGGGYRGGIELPKDVEDWIEVNDAVIDEVTDILEADRLEEIEASKNWDEDEDD